MILNIFVVLTKCYPATTIKWLPKHVPYPVRSKNISESIPNRFKKDDNEDEVQYYDCTDVQRVWSTRYIHSFIGTVGGSLGLFIGFSYTGFFGDLLDFFVKIKN